MGKAHEVGGDKKVDQESKRLRDAAISQGLLSRTRAHPRAGIKPSKVVLNCDGKDIVKRGQRKNKYLFAFPGLVAPVAGGKFGDLSNLDSRNPILYVDFPQGRLKMFGTIVYPKNKYLTLHFSRGAGNITCEDAFESLVVFSKVWWIGRQDENPEELRLPLPYELQQVQEKHSSFSFAAGAGRALDCQKDTDSKKEVFEPKSPNLVPNESEHLSAVVKVNATTSAEDTRRASLRHSTRTAARIIDAETASGEEFSSESEDSNHEHKAGMNSGRAAEILNERLTLEGAEQVSPSIYPLKLDSGDEEAKDCKPKSVSKTPIKSKNDKVAEAAVVSTPVSLTSDSEEAAEETALGRDELTSFDCERSGVETGTEVKKKGVGRASKSLKMVAQDALLAKQSKQKQDSTGTGGSLKKRRASASPANSKKKPERHGAVRKRDKKKVTGLILSPESAKKRNTQKKQKAHSLEENLDSSDGATSDDEEMSDSSDEDYVG